MIKLVLLVGVLVAAGAAWTMNSAQPAVPMADSPTAAPARPTAVGEQRVEIGEAELSQRLGQALIGQPMGSTPLGQATLKRLSIRLTNGRIAANGDAEVGSASAPISMVATPSVANNRPAIRVDELTAAGLPLPSSARDSVQQAIQAQMDAEVARLRLKLTAINVEPGKLVLSGTPT